MSQHILRYVRITNSGKLSDRYVTTQVKEASDIQKRVFGRLFLIVEMSSPWFPSSQIGQTIINTISREYFKSEETDLLVRFEATLKKVNETLDQLARTSEQEFSETLHAAILLQADNQLHIANTGNAYAWLIRDEKGAPLLAPTKTTPTSAKTFGSVLSGVLEPGDRVLVTSSGIYSVLNETELKTNIFAAGDFVSMAIRLTNLLKAKRGQWVNALALEYQDESKAANQLAHSLPDTLYLDTGSVGDWRLTTSQIFTKVREGLATSGSYIVRLSVAASYYFKTKVIPQTKHFAASGQQVARDQLDAFRSKTLPSLKSTASSWQTQLKKTTQKPTDEVVPNSPTDSLIGKTVFAIHDYQGEPEIEPDEGIIPGLPAERVRHYLEPAPVEALPQSITPKSKFPKISLKLEQFRLPRSLTPQSIGFVVIAIILLGLLINNLWAIRNDRSEQLSRTQAAQRLTELQDKLQEAKLAKIFNQSDKAIAAAEAVITGSLDLQSSPLADDGVEIAAEAQVVLDDLSGTTRLSNLTELGKIDGSRLVVWQDRVTVAQITGGIVTYPTAGGESATVTLPNSETLASMATFDGKDGYVTLSTKPTAYTATEAGGPLSPIALGSGAWHAGTAITAFLGNLYTLSPSENTIWKYTSTNGTLTEGQPYVTDGTDVSGGIDIAIDGNVYVLTKTGEIIKLNRGKRVELHVRDIPKPGDTLTEPKQIEAAGDKLYVLDKDRIIQLNTDGRFERQFALNNNEPVRAFGIKDSSLFALTNTRLIKTDLK